MLSRSEITERNATGKNSRPVKAGSYASVSSRMAAATTQPSGWCVGKWVDWQFVRIASPSTQTMTRMNYYISPRQIKKKIGNVINAATHTSRAGMELVDQTIFVNDK